jgi:imidazolonepropionase-like amidohydrolase
MHALQTEEFTVRAEVLPSPAILKHCTTNAAQMLRMEGKIGIIRAGAFADLLILNANPLEDVTVLDRPEEHLLAVMKEGRVAMSLVAGLAKHEKL